MENEKARAMVQWFDGREVQHLAPLQLHPHLIILDLDRYVHQSISTMQAMEPKLKRGIGVRIFRLSYLRLYELKQYIERNEQTTTT